MEEELERRQVQQKVMKEQVHEQGLSREVYYAQKRVQAHELREQEMAKELARRIAKEQEWGRLQEMAEELAKKKIDDEQYQSFDRKIDSRQNKKNSSPPFALDSVDFAERSDLEDDEISSLPTMHSGSGDSKLSNLSPTRTKDSNSPFDEQVDSVERSSYSTPSKTGISRLREDPPDSMIERQQQEEQPHQEEEQSYSSNGREPKSPSSVVELGNSSTTSRSRKSAPIMRHRYHKPRVEFGTRLLGQSESGPRPKPTWNPKPPKHYNRSGTTDHL